MNASVLEALLRSRRIVITTHVKPDGDAIGSELALALFLRKLGKRVLILNSDGLPYNLYWLPSSGEVNVFDGGLAQRKAVDEADLLVVVDTNAGERLGRLQPLYQYARTRRVLIDHHTNPERWFDEMWVDDAASSTGEMIYDLICAHDPALIDADIAQALYTAIMTDTGSFRYNSVTPRVHRIVADLMERGDFSPAPIHVALFDTRSREGLRLLGLALETLTICHDGKVGYVVVSQRMVRDAGSSLEETEGFVNYALSIEGVQVGILFSEVESGTKVSFRSKGDTYVNEWARSFGGGGHRNASGAFVRKPLQTVVDAVVAAAPKYVGGPAPEPSDPALTEDDMSYLTALMQLKNQNTSS